jgi:hypothetical protein
MGGEAHIPHSTYYFSVSFRSYSPDQELPILQPSARSHRQELQAHSHLSVRHIRRNGAEPHRMVTVSGNSLGFVPASSGNKAATPLLFWQHPIRTLFAGVCPRSSPACICRPGAWIMRNGDEVEPKIEGVMVYRIGTAGTFRSLTEASTLPAPPVLYDDADAWLFAAFERKMIPRRAARSAKERLRVPGRKPHITAELQKESLTRCLQARCACAGPPQAQPELLGLSSVY